MNRRLKADLLFLCGIYVLCALSVTLFFYIFTKYKKINELDIQPYKTIEQLKYVRPGGHYLVSYS